jgi:ABC-type multidrug transport system permease subunit
MSLAVLAQPRVPRAAFSKIVRNEARLAWRQPSGLIAGVGIPPLMFSGLYYPTQLMPTALKDIAHFTPLGAAVEAIQDTVVQGFVPAAPLLVLAAYAAVFGYLAMRFFRWE